MEKKNKLERHNGIAGRENTLYRCVSCERNVFWANTRRRLYMKPKKY